MADWRGQSDWVWWINEKIYFFVQFMTIAYISINSTFWCERLVEGGHVSPHTCQCIGPFLCSPLRVVIQTIPSVCWTFFYMCGENKLSFHYLRNKLFVRKTHSPPPPRPVIQCPPLSRHTIWDTVDGWVGGWVSEEWMSEWGVNEWVSEWNGGFTPCHCQHLRP